MSILVALLVALCFPAALFALAYGLSRLMDRWHVRRFEATIRCRLELDTTPLEEAIREARGRIPLRAPSDRARNRPRTPTDPDLWRHPWP